MSADETFTHKAFYNRKVNAVHSLPCLTAFVKLSSFCLFSKFPLLCSLKRVESFEWKGRPFSRETLDLFPVGSKFPPFLYVLTVFLQMEAHDVLHET